ncbi:MAG: hypothetical protein JW712_04550 [Dehalococcoidales bacterium]|nr:hypothetical protein [Dehalococcoidales bacterium]
MNTDVKPSVDALTCQMTLVLFNDPFAASIYLLALIRDQMCAEFMNELNEIAIDKITDLESALAEMFQLDSPDVIHLTADVKNR